MNPKTRMGTHSSSAPAFEGHAINMPVALAGHAVPLTVQEEAKRLAALKAASAPPAGAAVTPAAEASMLTPEQTLQKSEVEQRELLRWLGARGLTEAAHLPILRALGVHRVGGKVGSLAPLQLLSFAELSAELQGVELPCSPTCAADKAAVYQALQETKAK